ncbi:flagellar hook assembly protein FlgD [Sanguibacter antarcticus]|uniref:Flagellar basal-body rod modification protein FlgD n=1 Tax=Sanguibacter antarcticus TaxID=372484 RepID=A0A2A9DZW5_9MICO|nr:flagellar hook capping FlgD N-terminal domain-containing protein [Sanguibacter antarcticus]PFG32238.1 flagellar basal-body rod modification protein FlgD [Sanguibacter antarcticus]
MTVDTSAVNGASGLYTSSTGTSTAKKELDNETFMTLLVAQLKYQDPSSPMDTTEMMAQTTQLASMEQLTTLSTTMSESFALQMRMAAASLIGQEVTYAGADGAMVTGTATAVSYADSVPTVTVGGTKVLLDAVASVTQPGSTPAAAGQSSAS